MLFKPAVFITTALAAFAAATPVALEARTGGGGTPPPVNQCNTGSAQCCNSSGVAESYKGNLLWGLISVVVSDLTAVIGLQCSPILGGGSCNQTPVCCTGNNFSGLIVIGCSPLIIL